MDYGQMGAPQIIHVNIRGWMKTFWEEKEMVPGARVTTQIGASFPLIRMDEKHLKFVFGRIADQIKSKGIAGEEIRITGREMEGERNLAEVEIQYTEQEERKRTKPQALGYQEDLNFQGLSLPLGLARRIMKRNNGEMKVLRGEGTGTQILLRFPTHIFSQS